MGNDEISSKDSGSEDIKKANSYKNSEHNPKAKSGVMVIHFCLELLKEKFHK